jgi:hypothetical protein
MSVRILRDVSVLNGKYDPKILVLLFLFNTDKFLLLIIFKALSWQCSSSSRFHKQMNVRGFNADASSRYNSRLTFTFHILHQLRCYTRCQDRMPCKRLHHQRYFILWPRYWLLDQAVRFRFSTEAVLVSSLSHPDKRKTHPNPHPVGDDRSFLGCVVTGAWGWPFISIQRQGYDYKELYFHPPIRWHDTALN